MQLKKVKDFFEKVEGDYALQMKLKMVAENSNTQKAVAELVKIAAETGFNFTSADYTAARKQVAKELSNKKFSETEMATVNAGAPGCPCGYKCGLLVRF